jgi:hypothetical protein
MINKENKTSAPRSILLKSINFIYYITPLQDSPLVFLWEEQIRSVVCFINGRLGTGSFCEVRALPSTVFQLGSGNSMLVPTEAILKGLVSILSQPA